MDRPGAYNRIAANRVLAQMGAALEWWLEELRDLARCLLPLGQTKPMRLRVMPGDELAPADPERDRITAGRRHVTLQLDDDSFLYRKIKLPAAARKNIERVIRYEFNKYFPMQAENALFSCRVVPAPANASSVEVEIWALNRQQVDLYLSLMRRNFDIEVLTLFVTDGSGKTRIERNLEKERRRQAATRPGKFARALNGLLAGLALALIAYPVIKMDAYLEAQREEVARLEKKAQPIIELRENIMALDRRFQDLLDIKQQYPARADVWSYVTRVTAGEAVLERMSIGANKVHLTGKARSVERLLRSLESEQRISTVRIAGQVTATRDKRFEVLNLDLELRE